jgi:predicted transcriptional regulator
MKTESVETMDDTENILINELNNIGYTKAVAKLFVFFFSHEKGKSLEIEKVTSLRQPEVSVSMRYLKKMNVVTMKTIKAIGKGRPTTLYTRSGNKDTLIDLIINQVKERRKIIDNTISFLEKFKEGT